MGDYYYRSKWSKPSIISTQGNTNRHLSKDA